MDVFNLIAGAASILGLGFSAWAVVEVRRLRQRYVRMGLLPRWTDRLNEHASNLTSLVEGVEEDPTAVTDEIARLTATLSGLARIAGRSNKRKVQAVQDVVRQTAPIRHRDQVRSVRSAVYQLVVTLQLFAEEDQWT